MTKGTNEATGNEWLRVDDLEAQGYEVVGVLDKDSTEEDIAEMVRRAADKMTPPADAPIWRAITNEVIRGLPPRRYVVMNTEPDELAQFKAELAEHLAAGGDEDEFWARIRKENEERWEQEWDKGEESDDDARDDE